MGFDLTRAVGDSFGGRTSVIDRLVSYLYFADLEVIEQSTWDELGAGASLIGAKGGGPGAGLVFASPLPRRRLLAGAPDDPDWGVDLSRFLDLMARVWALSEVPSDRLRAPVRLVAYHSDVLAASLRSALESGIDARGGVVAYGPVGARARVVRGGMLALRLWATGGRPSRAAGGTAATLRVRAGGRRGNAPLLTHVLETLAALRHRGALAKARVRPASGSDLAEPAEVLVDAMLAGDPKLPAGWSRLETPAPAPQAGCPDHLADGLLSALARLPALLAPALGRNVVPVPVWLDGDASQASMVVVVPVAPRVTRDALDGPLAALQELVRAPGGRATWVQSLHLALDADPEPPPAAAAPPWSAALTLTTPPARRVMGPALEGALADPTAAAHELAVAYLALLREAACR